jgi:hypothetical protein
VSLGSEVRWWLGWAADRVWVIFLAVIVVIGIATAITQAFSRYDDSEHYARYIQCRDLAILDPERIERGFTVEQVERACLNMTRNP